MQESKLFQEGNIVITTDRIVWEEDVLEFSEIKTWHRIRNDEWKSLAFGVGFLLIGFIIGASWSIIIGLMIFGLMFWLWHNRKDEIIFIFENGQKRKFYIKSRDLFNKISNALDKQQEIIEEHNRGVKRSISKSVLSEIDKLPNA